MSEAKLISDIIAWENGDEDATKHFPAGTIIQVNDSDVDWFIFTDVTGIYYECDEKPEDSLVYTNVNIQSNVSNQAVNAYVPVPNMTPLERKFLLL